MGEGEGLQVDGGVALKGVHRHQENRDEINNGKHDKQDTQGILAAALALKAAGSCFIRHYCCTSLLRVDRSCRMLKKATSTKKITALA